jgi:hypothetical protein
VKRWLVYDIKLTVKVKISFVENKILIL